MIPETKTSPIVPAFAISIFESVLSLFSGLATCFGVASSACGCEVEVLASTFTL